MIKIIFTCEVCGFVEEIDYDDVEEKRVVPVCDTCYCKFQKQHQRLKNNIVKLYSQYQIDCPEMDF